MSTAKQMVEIRDLLQQKGHQAVIPRNTEQYALGKLSAEDHHESTKNKIEHDLIRDYYLAIKEADAVVVANYDKGDIKNYVGGNSFLEAGFAHVLNKKLYFANEIPNMIYSDELKVFQPVIINGDWSKIK